MRNSKRYVALILLCFMCVCMTACGKNKQPELADGKFIKYSISPVGVCLVTELYRTNVEVYQDGTVVIYADDFQRWLSSEEIPAHTTKITDEELEELKRLIAEEDLYNMRENVGNKNTMDGDVRSLTLYTVDGEHSSGGLNPSNKRFNKIHDYIREIVREEIYTYRLNIAEMQEEGNYYIRNSGIRITDNQDNVLINREQIDSVSMISDEEENYKVAILLNEEGSQLIANFTANCDKSLEIYTVYLDGVYYETISINSNIIDGVIYFNDTYTKEQAETIVQELSAESE